jgi:hypothetical protein
VSLAQIAYAAYGESTCGKNFRGEPMPAWADLPVTIQDAWVNATEAVVYHYTSEEYN